MEQTTSTIATTKTAVVGERVALRPNVFYQPELDALRFVAFAMVFVLHLVPFPTRHWHVISNSSKFGLPIFFMLSAYLIATLLLREREREGTIHVGAFYIRRVLRIWPLYFLVLALGIAFGYVIPTIRVPMHALPYFLLLCANVYTAHHDWTVTGTLSVLWSLSVEEQFYLFIPGLARLGGETALRWAAVVAILSAYVAIVLLVARQEPELAIWQNSFVQFQFFGIGILLALYLRAHIWQASLLARVSLLAAGAGGFVVAAPLLLADPGHWRVLLVSCGYALAMLACTAIFLVFHRVPLSMPAPLLYLGRISYGLYVFHPFGLGLCLYLPFWYLKRPFNGAQLLLAMLAAFAMTVALAALSYHFFELPILRFKERFAFIKSGPVAEAELVRPATRGL
jgi:peptidoglycan/LPS O-acetylase OafA/YrhL